VSSDLASVQQNYIELFNICLLLFLFASLLSIQISRSPPKRLLAEPGIRLISVISAIQKAEIKRNMV
jgi:hypothetical protein